MIYWDEELMSARPKSSLAALSLPIEKTRWERNKSQPQFRDRLSPLHRVLICGTHSATLVLGHVRTKLADECSYKDNISGMRLRSHKNQTRRLRKPEHKNGRKAGKTLTGRHHNNPLVGPFSLKKTREPPKRRWSLCQIVTPAWHPEWTSR